MLRSTLLRPWLITVPLLFVSFGCGDDAPPADGGTDALIDPDASRIPDGARLCGTDEQCDDGIPCTMDICDVLGYCRNPVDLAVCDDGIFCNGVEQCDAIRGCVPGPPETCNDSDVCTLDRCMEEERTCAHLPRDFDQDGEADWHCEGGTDCDDRDPTRGATIAEVCEDTIDNDCDDEVDESTCGAPRHDNCADALDVSAGGSFFVTNAGAIADYVPTCAPDGRKDVVVTFTLTEPQDVRIRAEGTGVTTVMLRNTCEERTSEFECASGFPGQVRARALPAGTYFAIVSDSGIGEIGIFVDITDATAAPGNETCGTPIDVSAGGIFPGDFVDVDDDIMTGCGFAGAPDLTYSFELTENKNVQITLQSASGETMSYSVRSTCDDMATEVRCARGTPPGGTIHDLGPGTYYIVAEGPSFREVDFTLDVQFLDPTPAPAGDTCDDPITLMLDTRTLGSLADKQDDLPLLCPVDLFYQDAVYSFTLASRQDVRVNVEASGTFMRSALRNQCPATGGQLSCSAGTTSTTCARDLAPGTYFAQVESFRGTAFNIEVETSPPTPSTAASGNDDCASAVNIPATGGLFLGDTTGLSNGYETGTPSCGSMARSPDATFRLDLTARKRVVATTECSSFDTVLHIHEGTCTSGAESFCDDSSGPGDSSLIDQILDPGTWFIVVDGWGASSSGAYTLEVTVQDP